MAARLRTLLERPEDLRPDFGPESLAILDTLEAAVHARMQDGRGVRPENLCDGASSEAVVLRAFRDAPTLREFAQLAATELLPIGAGPLMLSGGLRRSMLHRFDNVLQKKQVADTAALGVQSKRRELQTLKDEMNKTLCMAMCDTKDSKYSMTTEEGTCGGSAYGERCGHLVATLGSDGTVVASKAGIHIDTKRTKDHKTVWRSMKSVWSAFSQRFRKVGAWADDHLVEGWRNIDNGWIHLCPYHEEEIRRKNPAYWAYLVAVTALKFVVATQVKAFVNRQISDRLVKGIVGDEKELTEIDRIRLNAVLKDLPAEERKRILKDYPDLTYEGSDTPIVSKNGLLLGSATATKVKTNMDAEHRRLAYDADGMTDADRARLANKFAEYDGLSENTDISTASAKYAIAMKDGRITEKELKTFEDKDAKSFEGVKMGIDNERRWKEATQDGYLSPDEDADLRKRGVKGTEFEYEAEASKQIRAQVERDASDFNINNVKKRRKKFVVFGDRDRSAAFAQARQDSPAWQAAEIATRLKNKKQKYVTEEEQKLFRKLIRENPNRAEKLKLRLARTPVLTQEGLPMTEKQSKMIDLAKSAMQGDGVVTPSEMQELRTQIPANEWSVLGIEDKLAKGLEKFQSQTEKIRETLETSGGVINPDQLKGVVSGETMWYMQKSAKGIDAKGIDADPLAIRLALAMRSGNILREAGRKGYVAEADQERLKSMNPKDLKRYAESHNIVLNLAGTALNKEQYTARKVLLKTTKDGVINPVEAKKLLEKNDMLNQLNKEDTARLEQSRKNYDELERAVANEGVLDQKQTITLKDGTTLKASEALKQVSLSKNKNVKRVLKTQKQVDKLEKGKIKSLDADTLEHLRTTEKGRNIEATIVRNNPEMPAFRSRRTGRKGTLMAKEEAKLMDAMRQNIVDLTALQDVQKIKAAASLTEWRALDKVRKKYASQLKTVKKFQKMAGSPEAYDEMRAEVGAVGAGREDPLTEDYLTQRLSDIQEKMAYYDTHRFANVTSPHERGILVFEGLGELASDTMSHTSETGSSAYEWATRRDGDATEWEQLVDE